MKITLWGPRASGKTTYITMVYGTTILSTSKWIVRPEDALSSRFVIEHIDTILNGNFPSATLPSSEPTYYTYSFSLRDESTSRHKPISFNWGETIANILKLDGQQQTSSGNSDNNQVVVSFADVAGELYEEESLTSQLWDHLADSDGILCLLDPNENGADYFRMVFSLMQNLFLKQKELAGGLVNGRIPHYIAFCFSKIDHPDFHPLTNQHEKIIEFLATQTGINLDNLLSPYVLPERLEYFTISSLGTSAEIVDGQILAPQSISPINILQPLSWFFQNMEG